MKYKSQHYFHMFAKYYFSSIVLPLLRDKGWRYHDGENQNVAYRNMFEMAHHIGLTPAMTLMSLVEKHYWVLLRWAKGCTRPDDLKERILDIIVFLVLLLFMIESEGEERIIRKC